MSTYKLNVKALLEGALPSGSNMTTSLNSHHLIPLSNPYNYSGNPWGYSGTESVVSIPNSNITDWILVQLRDSTTPSTVIDTRAGFILKDGTIVDINGSSTLEFVSELDTDLYYVVIYHRNHISIMSSSTMDGSATAYDFTSSQSQAYGTTPMIAVGSLYTMPSGDVNADGTVDSTDYNLWLSDTPKTNVYHTTDCNLDARVNNSDYNNCILVNTGVTTQVP